MNHRLVQRLEPLCLQRHIVLGFCHLTTARAQTSPHIRIVEEALAQGGSRAEMARALRDGGMGMRMMYSNHVTSWPLSRAMAEWPAYLAASKRLGEAMRRQIEIERTQLYPDLPPITAD